MKVNNREDAVFDPASPRGPTVPVAKVPFALRRLQEP